MGLVNAFCLLLFIVMTYYYSPYAHHEFTELEDTAIWPFHMKDVFNLTEAGVTVSPVARYGISDFYDTKDSARRPGLPGM